MLDLIKDEDGPAIQSVDAHGEVFPLCDEHVKDHLLQAKYKLLVEKTLYFLQDQRGHIK